MSSKLRLGLLTGLSSLLFMPQPARAMLTIVMTATVDLNFGTITDGGAGGTVVISTAGARTQTGSVNLIAGAGVESQGIISITGSTGVLIDLSMTAPAFTVNNGAGSTMVVNAFNLVVPAGGAAESLTLPTNSATFPVGATLNVSAGQAAGTYTGVFTINANYQ